MKLIKVGLSVANYLQGRNNGQDEYVATFDDAQTFSMETAFSKFIDNLKNENHINIDKVNNITYSVVSNMGHIYNMAHECIAKERVDYSKANDDNVGVKKATVRIPRKAFRDNDIWELKPSNILRYCCTLPYRCQNLFIDENNTLVDITAHGVRDINDRVLYPQVDLRIAIKHNPYILVDTLYYIICNGYNTSGHDMKAVYEQDLSYLPGILLEDSFKLRKLTKEHISDFYRKLCKHNELYSYFIYGCKLNIQTVFKGQDKDSLYNPYRVNAGKSILSQLEELQAAIEEQPMLRDMAMPDVPNAGVVNNVDVMLNPFIWNAPRNVVNNPIPPDLHVENANIGNPDFGWVAHNMPGHQVIQEREVIELREQQAILELAMERRAMQAGENNRQRIGQLRQNREENPILPQNAFPIPENQ